MSSTLTLIGALGFYSVTAYLYCIAIVDQESVAYKKLLEDRGIDIYKSYGGKWKFLTLLNLYMDAVFYSICVINCLLLILAGLKVTKLVRLLNFWFTSAVFSVGCLVSIVFWGLYLVEKELIFPKKLEEIVPSWRNHVAHTLPLFAAFIENFFTRHNYSASFFKGFAATFFLAIAYIVWVFKVAYDGNFWVYPFLRVLTPVNRGLFFAIAIFFLAFLYKVGEMWNALLWPRQSTDRAQKQSNDTKKRA